MLGSCSYRLPKFYLKQRFFLIVMRYRISDVIALGFEGPVSRYCQRFGSQLDCFDCVSFGKREQKDLGGQHIHEYNVELYT